MIQNSLVVGNWKMNLASAQARDLALQIGEISAPLARTEVWVAPAFTSIPAVAEALKGSRVLYGSQNIHWEASGAFTGEISLPMLKELGCSFAIVGHSERRHVFGESNELVDKRALGALAAGFSVIFCIGEKLSEREAGGTNSVLEAQLSQVIAKITPEQQEHLIVAYEPVWAIGTGKVATLKEIEDAHAFIAEYCAQKLSADAPAILYGGSVTPDNFKEIVQVPLVAGALVGGASLSFPKFKALVEIAEQR